MASTSTNKQPLLIDRVFYEAVQCDTLASGSATNVDITGTNSSAVLVDCTTNDGGIVEDMFVISRGTQPYKAMFYFSSATDYLRANQAMFLGDITSATTVGAFTNVYKLPSICAPVPATGNTTGLADGAPLKSTALYIPRGKALWVTIWGTSGQNPTGCPIVGAQGGFF